MSRVFQIGMFEPDRAVTEFSNLKHLRVVSLAIVEVFTLTKLIALWRTLILYMLRTCRFHVLRLTILIKIKMECFTLEFVVTDLMTHMLMHGHIQLLTWVASDFQNW